MDVRTQLVAKIEARFQEITKADGYQTDIGLKVFPWRKAPMDAHSIPGIVFRDEVAQMNNGTDQDEVPIGLWEHRLKVHAEVFFKGSTSASEARKALDDVVRAVYRNRGDKWDNLAEYTDLHAHTIDVEQAGEVICGAEAVFIIIYRTPYGTL
ncbi:MAG: hypothetical protein A2Y38_24990 [Spirochaetes bacterium GWB1_59_5]|nr:MAG: hypothetical protein A2Y38_24990 [Spirochaetes bacterium GWB1_59_5]